MNWLNRIAAWARRLGFWRLAGFGMALIALWLALRGWTEPTAVNMPRR